MSRPKQDGLRYYPISTDFYLFTDKRIRRLFDKFERDGVFLYQVLQGEIYRNGYYIEWDEDTAEDITIDYRFEEGFVERVVAFLCTRSLITMIKLATGGTVITSLEMQEQYQESAKGLRRDVFVDPDIWLLSEEKTAGFIKITLNNCKSSKNDNKSGNNDNKSSKNDTNKINKINNISCAPEPHESSPDKNEQLEKDFEIIYAIYPKKRGRTSAFESYKAWVGKGKNIGGKRYKLTNWQIWDAVQRYVDQQKAAGQDDLTYWKNFDTLMGRQLLDYVEFEGGKK